MIDKYYVDINYRKTVREIQTSYPSAHRVIYQQISYNFLVRNLCRNGLKSEIYGNFFLTEIIRKPLADFRGKEVHVNLRYQFISVNITGQKRIDLSTLHGAIYPCCCFASLLLTLNKVLLAAMENT